MAMKASHIPRLGFCGLSPMKPCSFSISEMFLVSSEIDEPSAAADQGFLTFVVMGSFKKLKLSKPTAQISE